MPQIILLPLFWFCLISSAAGQDSKANPETDAKIAELLANINGRADASKITQNRLELAKLYFSVAKNDQALEQIVAINQSRRRLEADRSARAEALLLLGAIAQANEDTTRAAKIYLSLLATYSKLTPYSTEAFHRYYQIAEGGIPAEKDQEMKQKRRKALYKTYIKQLYAWKDLTAKESPGGALEKLRSANDKNRKTLQISDQNLTDIMESLSIPKNWKP